MPHAVRDETWIVSYNECILHMGESMDKAQYAICLSPVNGLGSFCVFGCPVSMADLTCVQEILTYCSFCVRTISSEVQKL